MLSQTEEYNLLKIKTLSTIIIHESQPTNLVLHPVSIAGLKSETTVLQQAFEMSTLSLKQLSVKVINTEKCFLKILMLLQSSTNQISMLGSEIKTEYINLLIQSLSRIQTQVAPMLRKKFYLQSADSLICINDFDLAKEMIENCCKS